MKSIKFLIALVVVFSSCKSKYAALEDGLYADIQTNKGDVLVKLHHKEVPMTVANFVSLSEGDNPKLIDTLKGKPFYDGLKFHRVIKNFMIQSGDPKGNGSGNAGYKFSDEFPLSKEGQLLYKHDKPGVLSMANSGPGTNSSQFFITHKATGWLDGKHSVFGEVEKGQTIIDTIQQNDYISKIDIIRIGKDAKKFNAAKVFVEELTKVVEKKKEREAQLEKLKKEFQNSKGIEKAKVTSSGLKILSLKEGSGKKFNRAILATIEYTVFLANGKLVQASDKGKPFSFVLKNQPMIAGVSEAILTMKEGGEKRLFIPYYLAYGSRSKGPIPAKSDLVFELKLVKVGK